MQTDKIEEFRKIYMESMVPAVKNQKGLQILLLLESVDAPGEVVSLSIWDSKENAEAYEKSGLYKEQVKKAIPLLTEAPMLKSYEVTVVHQA